MPLAYLHGASQVPLLGETIGACLDRAVASFGDREALVSCAQNVRYSYRQLDVEVERAARGLLSLGVTTGDRIGLWSPNCAEWVIAQYAAAKVGAILVNVNPAYRVHELEYALRQSGISVLISARRFRSTDYIAMLTELMPELLGGGERRRPSSSFPSLHTVVYLAGAAKAGHSVNDDGEPGGIGWSQLLARGDAVPLANLRAREATIQFDAAVNIQYTSGTTGAPKGATLSHHNILNNGYFVGEALRLTTEDRLCVPVPFYHCFGCVMGNLSALTHGSAVIIPAESFDAEATLTAVQNERCTTIYGVPTMFIAELEHPSFGRYKLHSLRTGIMAGASCPIEVMRHVMERMHVPDITICYGMTETSPVSFQSAVDDPVDRRVSTVGTIHPHVECKIVDPDTGAVVPRGTSGELCTRGYSVMLGYWNDDAATRTAIDDARWMHTGDLAMMRDDGYVNIVGRIKDMIIRGGDNIYPREIEEFLHTNAKISDVQVIGVPDPKYGEEVCAWIRLRDGEQATPEEIRLFCHGKIATYKIPRYIRFTTEFPQTVTGKIQKFKMREISIEELGLTAARDIATA